MSITLNSGNSEPRDDTLAALTQALEAITRSPPDRTQSEVLQRRIGGPSERRDFTTALARRSLPGSPRLWGLLALLAIAFIGVFVIARPTSENRPAKPPIPLNLEAAKADPVVQQQPVQAQTAPERTTAALISPEMTQWGQEIAHELSNLERGIEQLKASQTQLAHDNAELAGRLQATQNQTAQRDTALAERLKALQETATRDNLRLADQLKASQDQIAAIGEQKGIATPKQPARPPKVASPTPISPVLNAVAAAKPAAKPKPAAGQAPKNSTQSKPKQP